ncbi:hypothetical protein Pint_29536 [Pistacia integerrima]|uniref:Uncharacterized protein n=1 Tax=Pistacia integerrima TaxID=434235 RepID=A0ACC0X0H1_9ROSI|nr:hypothetical protein Pint_29536 [Pistacia integerrima]
MGDCLAWTWEQVHRSSNFKLRAVAWFGRRNKVCWSNCFKLRWLFQIEDVCLVWM